LKLGRLGTASILLAIAISLSGELCAQWKTPWTYEGAAHWGELDPSYSLCSAGKEQSPIDIRSAQSVNLPALRFQYKSGPLNHLVNNGYAIRVNYPDGGVGSNDLLVDSSRYRLTQFHFHHPSEEYIHGKPYEMAIHLMHESAAGKIVGVTVFLRAGHANPTVQKIRDHMPPTKGNEVDVPGVDINPGDLLPADTSYYVYEGSLTAPPCTENVTWLVLKKPVEVSRQQIAAFARLYPHDVRPVQPLSGRVVKQSR
jgi:carbonic anhydrase